MDHPLYTNRLIKEKSPYLLQHAHNPVDWYPWGEEAFEAAREQDKPIFLSIGYATCHWCHVMEEESFSNPEIAALMNDVFINVKVDREEMPEVDSLYMEFAQAMMSGGAGWPLNLVLTPNLTPFFASTYLPPDLSHGMLGLAQLVVRIREIWSSAEERERVIMQAEKIVELFSSSIQSTGAQLPAEELIHEGAEMLYKLADPIYGGPKGAPKFPIGIQASYLLRHARATSDSRALFYVEKSLDMMQRGGIFDHLGGGFARYTIDEKWLVPHFEKMLYDNAILARAYMEGWQYTHREFYREVAKSILSYIEREMTAPEGGFYSAQDADSEGREGRFYTWTWEEVHQTLGPEAELFNDFYGISRKGNFEGRNILHISARIEEYAKLRKVDPKLLKDQLQEMKSNLLAEREKRTHPLKDDKILTSWNGLMIYTFAEAGRTFAEEKYLDLAEKGADFLRTHLFRGGILYRRWREGESRYEGCLDDYAFFIHGAISLFEADRGAKWLELAIHLCQTLKDEFKAQNGAFFLTSGKDPSLLLRRCEFYDGAEPSGNGIHAENLIRLFQITGKNEYLAQAEDIFKAAKQHMEIYPPGACYHLLSLQRFFDETAPTLIVSLNNEEEHRQEIEELLSSVYAPHKVVIWHRPQDTRLLELAPSLATHAPQGNKTTLTICRRRACEAPITDLAEMKQAIESL